VVTRSLVRSEDQFCIYRSVESSGVRVLWELTSACNLKCDFCLVEIKRAHLPVPRALAIADELIAAGVDKVLLSGGEPLLYPGILPLMQRLTQGGVLVKLLTNGTQRNDALFDFVRASGTIEVSLSLPTVNPVEADRIFGAEHTLASIYATIDELPLAKLNIICAISQANVAGVGDVIDWVAARNIPCISLTNIFKDPSSPARYHDDCRDLAIGRDQRSALFGLIAERRARYDGRLAIRTTQFELQGCEQCMAGRTVFYLDPRGTLLPCTVTENRGWREAVRHLSVTEALHWYRDNLPELPASSCSATLAASKHTAQLRARA